MRRVVFALLDDGDLLVRSGDVVAKIDARTGKTLWSLPAIADADVDGTAVILRRGGVLFAVRASDAGVLWKRSCNDAQYAIGIGPRILAMCEGKSIVLRSSDGSLLHQQIPNVTLQLMNIRGARALNARYALVANNFDGAWSGTSYNIVDSLSGAFVWSQTDFSVLDVTATKISITPYPSMLPWDGTGTVTQRRLSDGETLSSRRYQLPVRADPDGRGVTTTTPSGVFVSTAAGGLFRCQFRGVTLDGGDDANIGVVDSGIAVRTGDRVAVSGDRGLTLFDERGHAGMIAQNTCTGERRVLSSATMLYVLCVPLMSNAPSLAAYRM